MQDIDIIPASELWIAPGGKAQEGSIVLGLKLVTGDNAAIAMDLKRAREVLQLLDDHIRELSPRKGSDPFPVYPIYPQKMKS